MNNLAPVEHCTGCAACVSRCPKEAIDMVEDAEGFKYPNIELKKCDKCGLCISICPVKNPLTEKLTTVPIVYAAWTKNIELLEKSSSGGIFSEIALNVLNQNGVVFGAAFDNTMTVRHIAVKNLDGLNLIRGSKYVQSNIGNTYNEAANYLKKGKAVLFCGTPCQIAGLYAAIGNKHERLLTIDLICHGVPSPKVFRKAIASIEMRKGSKVIGFEFRNKLFGWLYPTVKMIFANGKYCNEHNRDNHYNLGFLRNLYLRPCCHNCPIKVIGSYADITLGDFWQLIKYQPTLINRMGTSAVVVNSSLGMKAVNCCKANIFQTECQYTFLEKESNLRKSVEKSPKREAFFTDIDLLTFEELTQKYIKPRGMMLRNIAKFRRMARRWVQKTY